MLTIFLNSIIRFICLDRGTLKMYLIATHILRRNSTCGVTWYQLWMKFFEYTLFIRLAAIWPGFLNVLILVGGQRPAIFFNSMHISYFGQYVHIHDNITLSIKGHAVRGSIEDWEAAIEGTMEHKYACSEIDIRHFRL